jgi:hypothetical protein
MHVLTCIIRTVCFTAPFSVTDTPCTGSRYRLDLTSRHDGLSACHLLLFALAEAGSEYYRYRYYKQKCKITIGRLM